MLLVTALHVSGGFSAHRQELRNCIHSIGYYQAFLLSTASMGELAVLTDVVKIKQERVYRGQKKNDTVATFSKKTTFS
jgi:hypothetical protein